MNILLISKFVCSIMVSEIPSVRIRLLSLIYNQIKHVFQKNIYIQIEEHYIKY